MKRGLPFMFLTLTVNPKMGIDANHRARRLIDAWRKWVREVRKKHGALAVEYYYVFEAQQSGEPHLHIVGRWPRIEKEEISAWFEKEIQAPSTRIEGIKTQDGLAAYLTDYLTKGPTRFGTLKRYGYSRRYFIKAKPKPHEDPRWRGRWETVDRPFNDLLMEYVCRQYTGVGDYHPGFAEMVRPPPIEPSHYLVKKGLWWPCGQALCAP